MATIRVPLAVSYQDRDLAASLGNTTTDSFLINCYIETQKSGKKLVVKRPGLLSLFTYNGGAATNGQGLVLYKGISYAMGSNVLYRLNGTGDGSSDGTAWTASTAAPWQGRGGFGCIIFKGAIFVMGGVAVGGTFNFFNDVWSSPDGVNWTQLVTAAPWAKRGNFGVVVLGNTLYLLGGVGGAGTTLYNDVWSTQDGVNWTQVVGAAAWATRQGHMVAAFNQGIILAGGLTAAGTVVNDVWYSPDGTTWTALVVNAGWSIREYASMLVYNNKLWVAGGLNAVPTTLQDVWSSSDGINWTNTGNLPAARYSMASCVYAGKMWFIAGNSAAATSTTTVWSTSDGITFAVATAAYGGASLDAPRVVVLGTPVSVSTINAPTMWLIGGLGANDTTNLNQVYRATLNVAIPATYTPTGTGATTSEQWQFTTQNAGAYLVMKNTADAWVLYTGLLQKITSTNYPKLTVPGVVNLDDTIYVMDIDGVIYGSNLSDPFTWSALNFITADFDSDAGVMLIKYQNFVLALKAYTFQLFYDAGRFPGSPLLPATTYNTKLGCFSADSVASIQNTVVWAAQSHTKGTHIVVMDGTTAVPISTPAIDKILQDWVPQNGDHATAKTDLGHIWYHLSIASLALTICYDFVEKEWYIAKNGIEGAFRAINASNDGGGNQLMQDVSIGVVYIPTPFTYLDNDTAITSIGQTNKVDGGNNKRKFTAGLTVIGNRRGSGVGANNLLVQWSDDDAQTFNTGFTVDISKARPRIPRTGSFRRRTWKFTHSANSSMELEALEQEIVPSG